MRTSKLAVFVGLGLGMVAGGQGVVSRDASHTSGGRRALPENRSFWPPSPRNIVTQAEVAVTLDPGEAQAVYQVPVNQWFVLTSLNICSGGGGSPLPLALVEDFNGSRRTILNSHFFGQGTPADPQPPLGFAFRPGASMMLENRQTITISASSSCTAFAGYLVDDIAEPIGGPFWPPHPRNMVIVDSSNLPGFNPAYGHNLSGGGSLQLYNVPVGKDLVVTARWNEGSFGLVEDLGGSSVVKEPLPGNALGRLQAPVGIVFRSGSDVLLYGGSSVFFGLAGYLVDSE